MRASALALLALFARPSPSPTPGAPPTPEVRLEGYATHEHTRRQFKKQVWIKAAALGAATAAGEIDDRRKRALARLLAAFATLAWKNGYGRDLEDSLASARAASLEREVALNYPEGPKRGR